jgi:uncharacterized membrane protein YbhN (UPF0104 family)
VFLCLCATLRYWGEFSQYHREWSLGALLLGLTCLALSYLTMATGWFFLMAGLGAPIRLFTAMRASAYSLLAAYIPGKVFPFLTRVQICQEEGARPSKVLAASLLAVILSLVSALSLGLLSLLIRPEGWAVYRAGVLLAFIPLLLALHPKVIKGVMGRYDRWRGGPLELEAPHVEIRDILRPGGLYFLGWVLYGLGGYFILRSLVSVPEASLIFALSVIGIFNFAWALGFMFFIAPGGLGAREAALVWALSSWTPLGVAVIVTVLARLCQGVLGLSIAAVVWIIHRWFR